MKHPPLTHEQFLASIDQDRFPEAIYYLENRDPDNWANSSMGWVNQTDAVKAYHDGIVGWANSNDEVVTVKQ